MKMFREGREDEKDKFEKWKGNYWWVGFKTVLVGGERIKKRLVTRG